MKRIQNRGQCGLTVVEVVVSSAVLAMLLLCVATVTHTGQGVYLASQAREDLRQRAQSALDRIADAIETSSKTTFTPTPTAPFGSSTLDFKTPTGILNGVVSWGPTTRICLQAANPAGQGEKQVHGATVAANSEVVLIRNPGVKGSVTTVLATHVADLLEGETANGKDDNGNGLIDEKGLSFVLAGDQLTIRLTLAEVDADGHAIWHTTQTQVRLKN